MIKVRRLKPAEFLYRAYISFLLKSNFSKFLVSGEMPELRKTKGLIVTPNHFSWWDGFFAEYLMRFYSDRNPNLMMLEEQLKKYPFFSLVGAFSIEKTSLTGIKESLEYCKQIVSDFSGYLIYYPQGEIQKYSYYPVKLQKGLKYICEGTDSDVLTISFKIVYENKKKPAVICRFGNLTSSKVLYSGFEKYEKEFNENIRMLEDETSFSTLKNLFVK